MALKSRFITLASGSYETRTEIFEGREHLVVPVVALVEGVIYPANADNPELVTAEEFEHHAEGWNGRPIFEGHPMLDGEYVSGNEPDVLGTKRIGTVFNTTTSDKKLKMEAWIDVELCNERAPDLLVRLQEKTPIEISVGAFVDTDDSTGIYKGKKYVGAWTEITPAHLALLPEEDIGACSREAGCGVRAAKENSMDIKNLRNIPQSELDKLDAKDYAGPSKSFPIAAPEDVKAASNALGRAKGDRAAIKRKIVEISYRKGSDYVAQLPADWKRKDEPKSALARMLSTVTNLFRTAQDADEMGTNDLRMRLSEAISEIEDGLAWVDDYFPITDPSHVVYTCMVPNGEVYGEAPYAYPGYDYLQYERAFTLESDGTLTIQAARVRVRSVSRWEPIAGAQPESDSVGITTARALAEQITATGAPAASHEAPSTAGDIPMTKSEFLKALEGVKDITECQFQALADVLSGKSVAAPKVAEQPKVEEPKVAAEQPKVEAPKVADVAAPVVPAVAEQPKEVTLADLIAKATPDQRAAFEGITRAAAEKKAASIKGLKALGTRCPYSDVQLGAMDQAQLDSLVALAGVAAPKSTVDFSVAGARETQTSDAPAPPDMTAALRAARGLK
jgi:hypothetical protein